MNNPQRLKPKKYTPDDWLMFVLGIFALSTAMSIITNWGFFRLLTFITGLILGYIFLKEFYSPNK